MKVLISGASGQLAHALRLHWQDHELILPSESDFDLTSQEAVHRNVSVIRPDVVINAGAFTQVDLCETNPEKAMIVNGSAVGWLGEACTRYDALLVQISTDYVFDGRSHRPYLEEDPPGPTSWYGRSKLKGEAEALKVPEHLIVRTAWLYDAWGRNFFRTMLDLAAKGQALKVVDDQRGTPTTCSALARQLKAAVESGCRGILHATCSGETTWYGFAAEIFRTCGIEADLAPCTTSEFPRPAPRPAYSVLSGQRRIDLGIDRMPHWTEALKEVASSI